MKTFNKKLSIAILAISMAIFPALNVQAQAGAGTIAGVSTSTLAGVALVAVVVGAIASDFGDNDGFTPVALIPTATTTTTTTATATTTTTTTTTN
mgnify:CR=1 FL=1